MRKTPAVNPFASRLRALRAERGWSAYRLSQEAGLDVSQVSRIERGLRAPSWATVCRLADALGVTVDAFR